ncbi:MAG: DNA polymerase III subunit gamma/tau [Candidatus Omnitrophica bacterium]|nr:DNA polymerase III subunit gamma/tau [Candidatus Omnitrophota bacterium]
MSYTVFALKWRPQDFESIVGQNHIVTTLKNAIQRNRLAHAYLFAGPRGVGKTSTARILARALNCKEGPTLNPCGKCPSCIEIAQGRSFDVIEIDGASNRGIDEIRVLRENVKFPPTSGKFKIYIIDEVHQITPDGFNALLKTLEEPPPFVKFIFATTHPQKVIPTILSRCQRLDFRRIPVVEIIAQLERIARQEKIEIDKEVLFAIAKSSDGSLRDAESLLDQLSSFSKEKISLKDIVSVLGIVEQDALFEITDKIIKKDAKSVLGLLNTIIDEGKDTGVFLANLIEHFRNLMISRISKADSKLVDLPQDICDRLLQQAQNFTLEEIFSAFNILISAQELSKRLDSIRIPLEIGLVKLAHDKKGEAVIERSQAKPPHIPKEAKEFPKDLINNDPPPEPKKENPGNSAGLDDVKNIWQGIIDNLSKIKISAATYLNEGEPVKLQSGILTVSFPKNYSLHKESLERKENKEAIEKVVSELLNADIMANFILSKETAVKENNSDDSFIKSALSAFKARVIKEE